MSESEESEDEENLAGKPKELQSVDPKTIVPPGDENQGTSELMTKKEELLNLEDTVAKTTSDYESTNLPDTEDISNSSNAQCCQSTVINCYRELICEFV